MLKPSVCLAFAWALFTTSLNAATVAVESGGISGLSFTEGAGTSADPWVITEDMTGAGTLVVRNLGTGNPSGTFHVWGRWVRKTVTNNTTDIWTSFELELQQELGIPSGQGDGLSFADADPLALTFSSDKFSTYTRIDTTRDYLNFSGGSVGIGESVTFNFIISENSPGDLFYMLQTPNETDTGDVPEPGSMALAAAGLIAIGLLRNRR